MNYKKKNGNRKRDRLHGFRYMELGRPGKARGDSWRIDSAVRKHYKAAAAVEEFDGDFLDLE